MTHALELAILDESLAVCRLGPGDDWPGWATGGGFWSITRTVDELSVVCPDWSVPEGVRADRSWRAPRVLGVLDFALTGVLASLLAPLAEAGVPAFAVSTFDTDSLLVKGHDLDRAVGALRARGHSIVGAGVAP